jgi:hypothetical protein
VFVILWGCLLGIRSVGRKDMFLNCKYLYDDSCHIHSIVVYRVISGYGVWNLLAIDSSMSLSLNFYLCLLPTQFGLNRGLDCFFVSGLHL